MIKVNEHFVSKSDTAESDKDLWRTPQALFDALDEEFKFGVDVCATRENSLCDIFIDQELDALKTSWRTPHDWEGKNTVESAFINPPYSQTKQMLDRAANQAFECRINVVALVNANTDTKWFAEAASTANEIRLLTGRVGFVRNDGKAVNGNTKGQCLIIWRGRCKTPCVITMVDRDDLISKANCVEKAS